MQFIVLSRDMVEKYNVQEKHIVISIGDPDQPRAKLPELDSRVNALFLKFSDIDREVDYPTAKLFTKEQAKEIWTFFQLYKDKINTIVVNCEAGISRSSATAAALAKAIGQDIEDSKFFKYYLPNRFVYRMILEEANNGY